MKETPYPSQAQEKFVLRLPDGMRDRIKHAAETNNRSMNAEIVATLEEKYPAPRRAPAYDEWLEHREFVERRSEEILAEMKRLSDLSAEAAARGEFATISARFDALLKEHSELFKYDLEDDQFVTPRINKD